jgi:hypothetical protein
MCADITSELTLEGRRIVADFSGFVFDSSILATSLATHAAAMRIFVKIGIIRKFLPV